MPGPITRVSLGPLAQGLQTELERLRGVLREHGIEPGDDAT